MATIYAFSVDYDGCLVDHGVIDPRADALIRKIYLTLRADPDARAVLMVGSYRQSIASDAYCLKINQNGSCFPVYEAILAKFKKNYPDLAHRISLDKFLLADIDEKKPSGAHFELAVQQYAVNPGRYHEAKVSSEPIWHDQTKCGLQYVQMHHLATQFYNDTIVYCFHDNCDELILKPSHRFFNQFKSCIPRNVTLRHFCYALGYCQKEFLSTLPIRGLGHIDFYFRENIVQFEGKLHAPIPREKFSHRLRNLLTASNPDEHESRSRFFSFGQLLQNKGHEFVADFIGPLQNKSIQKEYDEYLLHLAVAQNNLDDVKNVLCRGANYLALNEQRKHALACAIQIGNTDMIACFAEYGDIKKNDYHLTRFILSMPMIEFYEWINSLIEKKLKQSVDVLLRHRLNEAAALSGYYFNTYLKIKNGAVHCTKKFFVNLIKTIMENQNPTSPMVDVFYQLHVRTSILPGDHFEEPALQALCFFVDEFLKIKCGPVDELLFATLMATPEITEKMPLTNCTQDQIIEKYYQRFLGYQAVMLGKIKEEFNDLRVVSTHIMTRFACSEGEITAYLKKQHGDVPWLPLRASVVNTPKQIILEAIRKQSIKNKGNERIQIVFFLLQCVVAQAVALPLIAGLFDAWKRTKIDVSSPDSVSDLLRKADDNAGCGCFSFFSLGNVGFLTQLPATIEAVSRYS